MLSQRNINAVNDFDTFETTEDRLTFLIHIPIHAGCGNKPATEKTTEKIVRLMKSNPYITNKELAEVCGITEDGVY
jgi:ATP-dependent DNA helicase RecG